jgi:hypothetical protein
MECEGCGGIFDAEELDSSYACETCSLEQAWWDWLDAEQSGVLEEDDPANDPSTEWTFVRDAQLI